MVWQRPLEAMVQLTPKPKILTVTGRAQRSMHIVHFKLSSNMAGAGGAAVVLLSSDKTQVDHYSNP